MSKELDDIKKLRLSIANKFEVSPQNKHWKTIDQIAKENQLALPIVTKALENSNLFVENKHHEFTTRKIYTEETPFVTKLIHSFKNRID